MLTQAAATAALLAALLPAATSPSAGNDDIKVTSGYPTGQIDVDVSDEGQTPGNTSESSEGSGASAGSTPKVRCTYTYAYTGNNSVDALDPMLDDEEAKAADELLHEGEQFDWYTKECTDGTWEQIPVAKGDAAPGQVVDPIVLAQRARSTLALPKPQPQRYPNAALADGRPFTVVNVPTWFRTSAASFKPARKRTAAGETWATVTAEPIALEFEPGDGHAPVSCSGPGSTPARGQSAWTASPDGCDYRYTASTFGRPGGVLTATYSIRWRVTWVGSGGTSGALPDMTTSTTATFAVAEAQTVVEH